MALHKFNLIIGGSVVVLEACSCLSSRIRGTVVCIGESEVKSLA